jgi:hypothetical protein
MKLSSKLVERTLSQFEAEAVPASHPAAAQFNELFGDHTFFLDADGLSIVEPAEPKWKNESGLAPSTFKDVLNRLVTKQVVKKGRLYRVVAETGPEPVLAAPA